MLLSIFSSVLFLAPSSYSFKYGHIPPAELVSRARRLGYDQLALADINSVSGAVPFLSACSSHGLNGQLGIDFRHDGQQYYVGLANNLKGWECLNRWLTSYLAGNTMLPVKAPNLPGCCFVYPVDRTPEALDLYEFVGIKPHQLGCLRKYKALPGDRMVYWHWITFNDPGSYWPVITRSQHTSMSSPFGCPEVRQSIAGPLQVRRRKTSL